MTAPTLDAEPACPEAVEAPDPAPTAATRALRAERRPFADIPRATWDDLVRRTPSATPFADWAFHRAWWDAYGANAHEETLVVVDADDRPARTPWRSCRSCTVTRSSRPTR